jgi:predicted PurR-regulated permease PerM
MPEPEGRREQGAETPATGGPGAGPAVAIDDERDTWRARMWASADARGIPLPTILAAAAVAAATVVLVGMTLTLLWVLRTVILYLVASTFIAVLLSPLVHYLERRGLSRGLATTAVFLAATLAFGGVVYLFTAPLVTAVTHFANQLPHLVNQAEHGRGAIGRFLRRFHLLNFVRKQAPTLKSTITRDLKPAQALSVGAAAFSTVVGLTTIAILSIFELLEAPKMRDALLGTLRPARRQRVVRVSRETMRSVTGYMLGNGLTSVIAGIVVFVTLELLGVPFAPLLGVFVALVDLLPLVGGLIAGFPTVIIALLHSLTAGIVMLAVFLVYQQIENHILNPAIMSKTVRLNPLWVLLAVLVGATLGDRVGSGLGAFIGALVGIPVGGAVQVLVLEIRRGPGIVDEPEGAPPGSGAADGDGVVVP